MLDHSRVSGRCPPVVDPSCLLGGLRPFRRDLRLTPRILLGEAAARDSWWQVSDMMGASPDRPVTVRVIVVLVFRGTERRCVGEEDGRKTTEPHLDDDLS